MYTPPAFAETRPDVLHDAIRATGLAILVSSDADGPHATHLPLLLDEQGGQAYLLGHLARANDHWRRLDGAPCLAIFPGPDAYVTPSWYPSKAEHGRVVPTWNYVAVHVHGPATVTEDPADLRHLVELLTRRHEAGRATPWAVDDAPAPFVAAQLKGIVGVSIRVDRMIGKWKMSQNRPPADRDGVVAGLEAEPGGAEAAALVRRLGAIEA